MGTDAGSGAARRRLAVVAVLAAVVVLAGCLPPRPSAGRATPVRRVLIVGDSLTCGLFGATPGIHTAIGSRLAARGIAVTVEGFPAENPISPWPGKAPWVERVRQRVAAEDPDMVVIQSMLFPDAGSAAKRDLYRAAIAEIYDAAAARGAHVYRVTHPVPRSEPEAGHLWVAQSLQAAAAAGRGIEAIPLDAWIARCPSPFWIDGWHLSGTGIECHAAAVTAAVDQLRRVVG